MIYRDKVFIFEMDIGFRKYTKNAVVYGNESAVFDEILSVSYMRPMLYIFMS